MCGIFGIFNSKKLSKNDLRQLALKQTKILRHRGPDWSGIYMYFKDDSIANDGANGNGNGSIETTSAVLTHERLSIVDPESGQQPLISDDKTVILAVNGEIYNHVNIRNTSTKDYPYKTHSDCEVILPLYQKLGKDFVNELDGMFAFFLWDEKKKTFFAARDHMGIIPMYIGWLDDGGIVFASELKALQDICTRFELFPPGHYFDSSNYDPYKSRSKESLFTRWYNPVWINPKTIPSGELMYSELRSRFEHAVTKCMMSDVPWGVLLSGGLDSSLVASIACRVASRKALDYPRIHSFSIGFENSPDLKAAKIVADELKTKHHQFVITIPEALDAVRDVIYAIETYDVTTIRASTPMYLMARRIKAMGVKMVISGEGSDEAMAGYLYFHKAPNKAALHEETVNKLFNLHYFDCLRANKSMSAWGVEPRVPFLDRDFLDYVMTIDPENKMCKVRKGDEKRGKIEKFILRKAFDDQADPYLPESILWRQKEQFSDGVGYNWIDSLRAKAENEVSAIDWETRAHRFPTNTPATKEAYYYRRIFEEHFPNESALNTVPGGPSIACSTAAAIEWDEAFKKLASATGGECSGRAVSGVHESSYTDVVSIASGAALKAGDPSTSSEAKRMKE